MLDQVSFPLPTISPEQASVLSKVDPRSVVSKWFPKFATSLSTGDVDGLINLFLPTDAVYWRDLLALTWDLRTFAGKSNIQEFLSDRLSGSSPLKLRNVKLANEEHITMQHPYPDLVWVQFFFSFDVGDFGSASGVVRLVPAAVPAAAPGSKFESDSEWEWRAHTVLTSLESLSAFPELVGPRRNAEKYRGDWVEKRQEELSYGEGKSPTVLVIGGGQSGLQVAARLKYMNVDALVLERDERLGGNWRRRYEALCLHDPVWYDHMPYLPFPPTWPIYAPARKMANWLEFYADALSLNVWVSTTVTSASYNPETHLWNVTVETRPSKEAGIGQAIKPITRTFTNVKHVVFATGFHGGDDGMRLPDIPGMDKFKGEIMHSLQFKTARDCEGKKVVVVGSCTSAHDIAADLVDHGVDVTMYQRGSTYIMSTESGWEVMMTGMYEESGPPTHVADLINASFPNAFMIPYGQRNTEKIAELDKELLDGLHRAGFKTNMGYKGAGCLITAWHKAGGYYLDVGASRHIISGKIKLKNGAGGIASFTETSIVFGDGSKLDADVVVFATGLGDSRVSLKRILGDELFERYEIKPVWGMDDEGELNGVFRDMGVPGLWCTQGNLALSRFHSKHIALQIKAIEEGIFNGDRYGGARPTVS